MTMTKEQHRDPLPDIDRAALQPVIQALLDDTQAELRDWRADPIYGGAATNTALYRVSGSAETQGTTHRWSLVLKVFRMRGRADDPLRWNYWKREPLAYQMGLLAALPGGLVAPRCYGVTEQRAGEVWLWIEDVADLGRQQWSLDDFACAARHLGRFNGAYLAGQTLPAYAWLSQGRLRAWVAFCADAVAALPGNLRHPLVQDRFSDAAISRLLQLWADREALLDGLDQLPRIFGHLDAFARNLTVRGVESCKQLIAIDWASVGFGAVGEELAPLIAASLIFFEADVSIAYELDAVAFTAYSNGLRDAGARVDKAAARFGYTAVAGLRYGLGIALDIGIAGDKQYHAWVEQALGHSVEAMITRDAAVADFLAEHIDEAYDLRRRWY
jgi:hypothetical protein